MKKSKKPNLLNKIAFFVLRIVSFIFTRLLGYRSKAKYKKEKDESVIILSNHQTDYDPFCLISSFPYPVACVATDNIFSSKLVGKILSKVFLVIPKRKGAIDMRCVIDMVYTSKNNGSMLLFPEGNRTYAEFSYYISPTLPDLLKKLKSTIVIFNLHGGTGIRPRFSSKLRKGKFEGDIKKVLKYSEYENMPNEELYSIIVDGIKVYDSESGNKYTSSKRAEYLERMMFTCPVCSSVSTLHSDGNYITCSNCGEKVEYTETMSFKGSKNFPFKKTIEWWNYQKRYIHNLKIEKDKTIFSDDGVKLLRSNPNEKRKLLAKGKLIITDKFLIIDKLVQNISDISIATVISGKKLSYTLDGCNYTVTGNERFNPLKYVLLFNKLDTKMKLENKDNYYTLKEDER